MVSAVAEQRVEETIDARTDVYMHVWPLAKQSEASDAESVLEVELIAAHTSNPNHLDPSCPACGHLRVQLQSIVRTVVEGAAALTTNSAAFEIYTDLASIICSPTDGQRPSVTVSIYVRNRFDDPSPRGIYAAMYQIKHSLKALGIHER